jgi:hypothetical protein
VFHLLEKFFFTYSPREIDVYRYLDSTEFRTSTEAELRTAEHRGELESEVSEARFEDDLSNKKKLVHRAFVPILLMKIYPLVFFLKPSHVQSSRFQLLYCTCITCFWAFRIHYSKVWIRIRILLSSCKNSKKNLDSYYFVILFDFLSYKNNRIWI